MANIDTTTREITPAVPAVVETSFHLDLNLDEMLFLTTLVGQVSHASDVNVNPYKLYDLMWAAIPKDDRARLRVVERTNSTRVILEVKRD